jgi:toxin-antitoxin system PIN domain toxin
LKVSGFLLDVNVLVALVEEEHLHHRKAVRWFKTAGRDWGMCAFSEAGLLRALVNPVVGNITVEEASAVLASLVGHPGYRYWAISWGWAELAAPFRERIFGHQQITDAYLLGLAVRRNGILVSMDKGMRFLAGPKFSHNVLILE